MLFKKYQVLEAENKKNYNFESKGKPAEIFQHLNDAVQFVGVSFYPSGGL